ncbi:hypothetical protein [Dokdonella sp.]|uniref:hypothetical protein n=1 Tax=Dokdonella sp. TaxID=2291710 RepID=UPI003529A4F2
MRNTTIINNTYITNVYNDYSYGRPINNGNYAYRNNDLAVTAVTRDAFVNARSVDRARSARQSGRVAAGSGRPAGSGRTDHTACGWKCRARKWGRKIAYRRL